jgi:polyhydroxyalkanoate synthesis regulator phasin
MTQPPGLEARVTALETQVSDLAERVRHSEQDAAAARVLAGGADRDVADLRSEVREFRDANNRTLTAMREDLIGLRGEMTGLRGEVTGLRSQVDNGFAEMRGKLDAAATGLEQISGLLSTLIGQDGPGSGGR